MSAHGQQKTMVTLEHAVVRRVHALRTRLVDQGPEPPA